MASAHRISVALMLSVWPQIARAKARDLTIRQRVLIFSAANEDAQPTVISYEKMPRKITTAPLVFRLADGRIKLENLENNLLIPTQRERIEVDTLPTASDPERTLPPGMTEEDLRDDESMPQEMH